MAEEQERPPRSSTAAVFDRINKVENDVAQLREVMAGMNVNLTNQGQTLTRIASSLDARSGTDWKALASWATVLLGIVGLVGSLVLSPMRGQMESNRAAIDRLAVGQAENFHQQLVDAIEHGRYRERVDQLMRERDRRGAQ